MFCLTIALQCFYVKESRKAKTPTHVACMHATTTGRGPTADGSSGEAHLTSAREATKRHAMPRRSSRRSPADSGAAAARCCWAPRARFFVEDPDPAIHPGREATGVRHMLCVAS